MDWNCLNCKSFNALKSSLCPNCYEKEMILKGIPSNNDVDISTITNMLDDLKVRNEQDNFNFTLTQDVNSLILFSTQKSRINNSDSLINCSCDGLSGDCSLICLIYKL